MHSNRRNESLRQSYTRLLVLSCVSLPNGLHAEEQYCLSGGFRNGYSCEAPLVAEWSQDKIVFSIQLLEGPGQDHISARDQVAHVSSLPDDQRLVYLGGYSSQAEGMQALHRAVEEFGMQHYPMLVELTPSQYMPRIRLVAEPNRPVDDAELKAANGSEDLRYAIQLGAFKGPKDARKFSQQLSMPGLLCRQKDNGMYAVYYREFSNYADAQTRLNDHSVINTLGGYVVALRNVDFSSCGPNTDGPETRLASNAPALVSVAQSVTQTTERPQPKAVETAAPHREEAAQPELPMSGIKALEENQSQVFTIQTAAFQRASSVHQFASRHSQIEWTCRVKNNGMFAIYYGAYASLDEARSHLKDHALLSRQKAYVVQMRDVSFSACESLND